MGIRSGFKIRSPRGHVGSSPTPGMRGGRPVAIGDPVESPRMSATDEAQQASATFHGGRLIARRLKAHGVSKLFTLSGGHLFSIYDGCREEGIEIVDVRHESTAAFAR